MAEGTSVAPQRGRILIVDDIELNRILTQAVLAAAAYDVDSVGDGAAALSAIDAKTYDLVLMDLDMPGLDGHAAAAAIQRRTRLQARSRIVALTAREGEAIRAQSRDAGMETHIRRPIAPPDLIREVDRLLATPAPAETPAPTWCRETYDELARHLSPDRMRLFMEALLSHCEAMQTALLGADTPKSDIEHRAHDLVSVAGMLGFINLARVCFGMQRMPEGPVPCELASDLAAALGHSIEVLRGECGIGMLAA